MQFRLDHVKKRKKSILRRNTNENQRKQWFRLKLPPGRGVGGMDKSIPGWMASRTRRLSSKKDPRKCSISWRNRDYRRIDRRRIAIRSWFFTFQMSIEPSISQLAKTPRIKILKWDLKKSVWRTVFKLFSTQAGPSRPVTGKKCWRSVEWQLFAHNIGMLTIWSVIRLSRETTRPWTETSCKAQFSKKKRGSISSSSWMVATCQLWSHLLQNLYKRRILRCQRSI